MLRTLDNACSGIVVLIEVDGNDAIVRNAEREPVGMVIDHEDLLSAEETGTGGGHVADRPRAKMATVEPGSIWALSAA